MFRNLEEVLSSHRWPTRRTRPSFDDLALDELLAADADTVGTMVQALDDGPCLLFGPANVGKTFLSLAVGRAFLEHHGRDSRSAIVFYGDQYDFLDVDVLALPTQVADHDPSFSHLFIVDDVHLAQPANLVGREV